MAMTSGWETTGEIVTAGGTSPWIQTRYGTATFGSSRELNCLFLIRICHQVYTRYRIYGQKIAIKSFSWDQAGYYDIPAMIDHVLNVTGQDSLQYVGFSMGTTGFMVAANEHQEEIADKVKMAHLVAPVAYVQYMRTPLVVIKPISKLIEVLMRYCSLPVMKNYV